MQSKINSIQIIENIINPNDLNLIIEYINKSIPLSDPSGYSPFLLYDSKERTKNLDNIFSANYIKCKNIIEEHFQCEVYDEGMNSITELQEGHFMPIHYDHGSAENKSVGLKTGAGHPSRDISSVLYYNDNFEGGEINFPNQNLLIKPKPGMFICFPANDDFPHEVKKITSGRRWCSTAFWCIKNTF